MDEIPSAASGAAGATQFIFPGENGTKWEEAPHATPRTPTNEHYDRLKIDSTREEVARSLFSGKPQSGKQRRYLQDARQANS